jgi:hypothetical protein
MKENGALKMDLANANTLLETTTKLWCTTRQLSTIDQITLILWFIEHSASSIKTNMNNLLMICSEDWKSLRVIHNCFISWDFLTTQMANISNVLNIWKKHLLISHLFPMKLIFIIILDLHIATLKNLKNQFFHSQDV